MSRFHEWLKNNDVQTTVSEESHQGDVDEIVIDDNAILALESFEATLLSLESNLDDLDAVTAQGERLCQLAVTIETAQQEGGMAPSFAQLVNRDVQAIMGACHHEKVAGLPAMEDYGSPQARGVHTQASLEAVYQANETTWERIKAILERIWEYLKEVWAFLTNAAVRTQNALKDLKTRFDKLPRNVQSPEIKIDGVSTLSIDNKFSLVDQTMLSEFEKTTQYMMQEYPLQISEFALGGVKAVKDSVYQGDYTPLVTFKVWVDHDKPLKPVPGQSKIDPRHVSGKAATAGAAYRGYMLPGNRAIVRYASTGSIRDEQEKGRAEDVMNSLASAMQRFGTELQTFPPKETVTTDSFEAPSVGDLQTTVRKLQNICSFCTKNERSLQVMKKAQTSLKKDLASVMGSGYSVMDKAPTVGINYIRRVGGAIVKTYGQMSQPVNDYSRYTIRTLNGFIRVLNYVADRYEAEAKKAA